MTDHPDDLRELVGDDVPPAEMDLIARADAALRTTPAPPESSESLAARIRSIPGQRVRPDRRRILAGLAVAAAIAGAAFGIGLWANGDEGSDGRGEQVTLAATPDAPRNAQLVLEVLPPDKAGNWAMLGEVKGLQPLPQGSYYEMWLTKNGKLAEPCGRFVVDENGRAKDVWFNAPYEFGHYERWVVVSVRPGEERSKWLLDGPVTTPA